MSLEEWEKLYDEVYDLRQEFHQKWRKNDFRYQTHKRANDERVSKIANLIAQIILYNEEINEEFFKGMDDDKRYFTERSAIYKESLFTTHSRKVLDLIESKINELSV